MRNLRIKEWGMLVGLILLFSCQPETLYNQYQVINETEWRKEKVYYFTFEVNDITKPYDVQLYIRNNNQYPYQNLWLFVFE